MTFQEAFEISTRGRGTTEITAEVARSVFAGVCVTVPVADGKLLLGTWQGIYLWEHRTHAHTRRIVATVTG